MAKLAKRISEAGEEDMAVDDDMVVILWVMVNSLHFVEDEDGARYLPKKGDDGKYHIEGLFLATGKQASEAMKKFLPILRRMKKNN